MNILKLSAPLPPYQEAGSKAMAARLVRQSGHGVATIGLRRHQPQQRRLAHLYRFLWQWGPAGQWLASFYIQSFQND